MITSRWPHHARVTEPRCNKLMRTSSRFYGHKTGYNCCNIVEFEECLEEDNLTDDEFHSDAHWRKKDQKSIASKTMRLQRSYCKPFFSGNWCGCASLHHCNIFQSTLQLQRSSGDLDLGAELITNSKWMKTLGTW